MIMKVIETISCQERQMVITELDAQINKSHFGGIHRPVIKDKCEKFICKSDIYCSFPSTSADVSISPKMNSSPDSLDFYAIVRKGG